MKPIFLFMLLIFFNALDGRCQELNSAKFMQKKWTKMDSLDIVNFEKYKFAGRAEFLSNDKTIVQITDGGDTYKKIIRSEESSAYSTCYEYFKNTLHIKSVCQLFYDIVVGVFTEYDEQGNIIKKKNSDASFPFKIENVIDKLNKDYKINLLVRVKNSFVNRYVNKKTKMPEYEIFLPVSQSLSHRRILINGNNGSIISDTVIGVDE